jgi:Family of unknown function (DUF6644)
MSAPALLTTIENSAVADAIRESPWLFPTIETVHVLAIVLVVGTIVRIDLRLLSLAFKDRPVSQLTAELLPWTWTCFVIAALSGSLMFISAVTKYLGDAPFRWKMLLLGAAGVNMLVFHSSSAFRNVATWDRGTTPPAAKVAGGISLAIWLLVVACGRWIGFTT